MEQIRSFGRDDVDDALALEKFTEQIYEVGENSNQVDCFSRQSDEMLKPETIKPNGYLFSCCQNGRQGMTKADRGREENAEIRKLVLSEIGTLAKNVSGILLPTPT